MLKSSLLCLYSSNLGTFWLKKEQFEPFEEISIFCNGGHLGYRTPLTAVLYPRWPPLLKIEISSNGQNCSILSQKVPIFERYKHNDELFNVYYKISSCLFSNLHNRSKWVMGFTSKLQGR
jgi:hypothetical protein